mgnify:FL=1|jgi:hypothetical protein|tara:strand:+ start:51 stop:1343 length:1293 start_codon:yes stop_codon:yes gene_type:complete
MKVSEYRQMMAYLTRPGPTEERTNFVLGGAAIKGMRETVTALTKNLDRLPTQNEIVKATGKAAKTIKSYFKEGVDYLKPMSKKESAKLGGKKPTGITTVTDDFVKNVKNLKATHISPTIETTKAGSKSIRVSFTGPIKNDFKDIFLPATKENLNLVKSKIDDITKSATYKDKARVFKSPIEQRKIRRSMEAMYKKQDPYGVYKALQKYKTKKFPGTMSKDIVLQHGDAKFTTQTLSRMGLIPSKVNISPAVERIERLRNQVLRDATVKLNNPKRSNIEKQAIIDELNSTYKGLKNQLKGTEGQGLVNFQMLKLDDAGNVIKLKDVGFNPKKGLAYGDELGELDFANITKEQADEIIKLGKRKIDLDLLKRQTGLITADKLKNPLGLDLNFYGGGRVLFNSGGVKSGPPPERGPNSEGLASLRNYATRTME